MCKIRQNEGERGRGAVGHEGAGGAALYPMEGESLAGTWCEARVRGGGHPFTPQKAMRRVTWVKGEGKAVNPRRREAQPPGRHNLTLRSRSWGGVSGRDHGAVQDGEEETFSPRKEHREGGCPTAGARPVREPEPAAPPSPGSAAALALPRAPRPLQPRAEGKGGSGKRKGAGLLSPPATYRTRLPRPYSSLIGFSERWLPRPVAS